jgi:hypothetical protein
MREVIFRYKSPSVSNIEYETFSLFESAYTGLKTELCSISDIKTCESALTVVLIAKFSAFVALEEKTRFSALGKFKKLTIFSLVS